MNVEGLLGKFRKARMSGLWKDNVARKEKSCIGKVVQQLHVGKKKAKKRLVDCLKGDMLIVG